MPKYSFISLLVLGVALGNIYAEENKEIKVKESLDGCVELTVQSASKEKIDLEIKQFKEVWGKQANLKADLLSKKLTIYLSFDIDKCSTANKVAQIVHPYKKSDTDIWWEQLCIDEHDNIYNIKRCISKEKAGLPKDAESCTNPNCYKISVQIMSCNKSREVTFKEIFKKIYEIVGNYKTP